MKVVKPHIPGLIIIEPQIHGDERGFFMETYQKKRYEELGIPTLVQDNLSFSRQGVLRGLHFQNPSPQGKLVHVLKGEVFDAAVDIRTSSPTFKKWFGLVLSEDNKKQFWIPQGFAHGFCVLSQEALFTYKCTDYYNHETEMGILWNDPQIGIDWPIKDPVLSEKDRLLPSLKDISPSQLFA